MAVLAAPDREKALRALGGWAHDEKRNAIGRTFTFKDFSEAFAFMTRAALAAEKADHHPDWSNMWNKVEIWLSTHDEGGVTDKDLDLAEKMNGFAEAR
jgi:4a-hydroxytetrahydrobiopterin dehydratase